MFLPDKDEVVSSNLTRPTSKFQAIHKYEIWEKDLPPNLLSKCKDCNEICIPLNNLLKIGGSISVFTYIFVLFFRILFNLKPILLD